MKHFLLAVGLVLAGAAGLWWWTSRPPTHLADTDYVVCRALEIQQGIHEGVTACEHAAGAVAGPVVLAAIGAFLILLGVILYAGRRQAGTVTSR